MAQAPRLPGPKDRIAVIGSTGSGKTVAALWHLSRANLNARPWIVFDFKDDDNVALIEKAQHVGLDFRPGADAKGIYVVHPMRTDDDALNDMLVDLLQRGNVGLYFDEPDMNRATGFEDVLRKGRSHFIPVIALTQRPVDCNRYMLSEAGFYQVFDLADQRDWNTVKQFIPGDFNTSLKKHHSLYYDRDRKQLTKFAPVPTIDQIMRAIDVQLTPRQEVLLQPKQTEKRKRVLV
jgi:hypothetical protein